MRGSCPVIETPRLRLRRLRPSDEGDLIALDSDPEVMRYVGSPPGTQPADETAARVRQRIAEDRAPLGFWLVEGRAGVGAHGLCALLRMPAGGDIELAYRLARDSWGRGIATEAARALVGHAFGALSLPRLVAVTYPENLASQRVLEKVGFVRQGFVDYQGVRAAYYVITGAAL
jgi:RimJ/RimL family protein N-acetyltransferase